MQDKMNHMSFDVINQWNDNDKKHTNLTTNKLVKYQCLEGRSLTTNHKKCFRLNFINKKGHVSVSHKL